MFGMVVERALGTKKFIWFYLITGFGAVLGASVGDRLSSPLEAQRLVDALLQSENPEFTAAGRRIIAIVPADEIEKRF